MLAEEGRAAAAEWFAAWVDRGDRQRGTVGAYVMGSLASLSDGTPFDPDSSDIDVAIVVDPAVLPPDPLRYPHGRFELHRGFAIQAIFLPAPVLADDDRLLLMLGLGCNLRQAHVLADEAGVIDRARAVVARRWAAPEWTRRRFERAADLARAQAARLREPAPPADRVALACDVVMQIAGLPVIANREVPTHRRALAKCRATFDSRPSTRASETYTRLLGLVGGATTAVDDLEAVIADGRVALEAELRGSDAVDLAPDLLADLPRRGEAGIRDVLVRDGVREAMLPALGGVSISCSLTLRSPAVPEPDRRPLEDIARRAERRILDSRTWDRYAEAAAQVGVEMEGLSERLLPRGS